MGTSERDAQRRKEYRKRIQEFRLLDDEFMTVVFGENIEATQTYVIFITEKDVLGGGQPLYHIERRIKELDAPFGDGSHIIYVNGAYQNEDDAVGKLMVDFQCKDAAKMHYDVLAERVRYFKQSEGGQENMSQIMEELRNEAKHDTQVDVASAMLKDGVDIQTVSKYSGLPPEEVEVLAGRESA